MILPPIIMEVKNHFSLPTFYITYVISHLTSGQNPSNLLIHCTSGPRVFTMWYPGRKPVPLPPTLMYRRPKPKPMVIPPPQRPKPKPSTWQPESKELGSSSSVDHHGEAPSDAWKPSTWSHYESCDKKFETEDSKWSELESEELGSSSSVDHGYHHGEAPSDALTWTWKPSTWSWSDCESCDKKFETEDSKWSELQLESELELGSSSPVDHGHGYHGYHHGEAPSDALTWTWKPSTWSDCESCDKKFEEDSKWSELQLESELELGSSSPVDHGYHGYHHGEAPSDAHANALTQTWIEVKVEEDPNLNQYRHRSRSRSPPRTRKPTRKPPRRGRRRGGSTRSTPTLLFDDKQQLCQVEVRKLRYSQLSCRDSFHDGGRVIDLVEDLLNKKVIPKDDFLRLTVYEHVDSKTKQPILKCINNRRLYALKMFAKKTQQLVYINVDFYSQRTLAVVQRIKQNSDKTDGQTIRFREDTSNFYPQRRRHRS